MRYYIIAGEASGDLHGSNLMKELDQLDSHAKFRFFGGDLMANVGGDLVKHYREMAYMGFLDVLMNLKTIKRNMSFCKKDILEYKPDVLILIDYPGFNLRIAEFARQNDIKVYYYISPKLWAWKEYRVKKIRAFVDEMFTIFPFETQFYRKHDIEVEYVGNPLMDSMKEFREREKSESQFRKENNLDERPIVSILAGSRIKEVKRILPVMLQALEQTENYQYVIAGVNNLDKELYQDIMGSSPVRVIYNQTYDLLNHSYAAMVASGTAALETALFNIPQVVLYKVEGGRLVDVLFRNLILKTNWVSLPNIILQKTAVQELIQKDMTVKKIKTELNKLLTDNNYRENIERDYKQLQKLMGEPGCSKRAAEKMIELLN